MRNQCKTQLTPILDNYGSDFHLSIKVALLWLNRLTLMFLSGLHSDWNSETQWKFRAKCHGKMVLLEFIASYGFLHVWLGVSIKYHVSDKAPVNAVPIWFFFFSKCLKMQFLWSFEVTIINIIHVKNYLIPVMFKQRIFFPFWA